MQTQNKKIFRVLLIAPVLLGVSATLYLLLSGPVLLRWETNPIYIRSPERCIANPIRDRTPEHLAEELLAKLKAGNVQALSGLGEPDSIEHFQMRETQYPIVSWHLGNRVDSKSGSEVTYWVERGGGYGGEEVVCIILSKVNTWVITRYAPIY